MQVGCGAPSPTTLALWEPSAAGAASRSLITAAVSAPARAPPACQGSAPRTAAAAGMQHYPQSMDHYVINKRKVVLQMRLSYHFTTRRAKSISPPGLTRMDRCWGQMGADSEHRAPNQAAGKAPAVPAASPPTLRWEGGTEGAISHSEADGEQGVGCACGVRPMWGAKPWQSRGSC